VAVLQALRAEDTGAGAVGSRMGAAAGRTRRQAELCAEQDGLLVHSAVVLPEWVDYNGHAHESRLVQVFGDATDALLAAVGIDAEYLRAGGSYYTVETHLSLLREALAGQRLRVTTQVLGSDDKRLHVFHSLYRDDDGRAAGNRRADAGARRPQAPAGRPSAGRPARLGSPSSPHGTPAIPLRTAWASGSRCRGDVPQRLPG
jgi:acyl-CoA thioesterase FadM